MSGIILGKENYDSENHRIQGWHCDVLPSSLLGGVCIYDVYKFEVEHSRTGIHLFPIPGCPDSSIDNTTAILCFRSQRDHALDNIRCLWILAMVSNPVVNGPARYSRLSQCDRDDEMGECHWGHTAFHRWVHLYGIFDNGTFYSKGKTR